MQYIIVVRCELSQLSLSSPVVLVADYWPRDNTNIKTSFNSTRSRSLPQWLHQSFFVKKLLYKLVLPSHHKPSAFVATSAGTSPTSLVAC